MFSSNTSQVSNAANYIEDVFSTYLYTGNGTSQTITNGIDLSGKGGLTWFAGRNTSSYEMLFDSARGVTKYLLSGLSNAEGTSGAGERLTAYNNNGFSLGTDPGFAVNASGYNYVSWTFRKQPKFFDVVTYTGTGANRTIAHALGSTPGCIIVKRTDTTGNWQVYHNGLTSAAYSIQLNLTNAQASATTVWNSTAPTSTVFSVGTDATVNASGGTYVAYLFAHNAGGFGLTGTDNVISCGSYTGSAGAQSITLGYEPQWILIKRTDTTGDWVLQDSMRGMSLASDQYLQVNTSNAENSISFGLIYPNATGFTISDTGYNNWNVSGGTYIYIAIRRGPMKVPTDGTNVFGLNARSGTNANATVTGGQTDDAVIIKNRGSAVADLMSSRLTGTGYLVTSSTAAEVAAGTTILQANPWDVMDGVKVGTTSTITNASGNTFINYLFRRAPNFFDEVCYTGTGANTTQTHNLSVAPEMMIVKRRDTVANWPVYNIGLNNGSNPEQYAVYLNLTNATGGGLWNSTAPTSTVFSIGTHPSVNASGGTYVAYLFASCPGVSKVGSFTGNGSSQTINCGFTAGARFVMIKRTDSTGEWYVWDSARGIVPGNDPYLSFSSQYSEDWGGASDSVDADASGFIVNQNVTNDVNVNGASYIFLAIA